MVISERVKKHPILPVLERKKIIFYFKDKECVGYEGEVLSSSLFANGINIFGHHYKDGWPLGIFCANGQCSRCLVIADGKPVKACMTEVKEGMRVYPCDGLPHLPKDDERVEDKFRDIEVLKADLLVVGGGPSGISAAIEVAKFGKSVILVDDKSRLGGKLVLQTHTFFGSIKDCYAGTRGIDIANILADNLSRYENVDVYLNATAIGVFGDKRVGVIQGDRYFLVEPKKLLIATGAREKALSFEGWDLPGVYGAGAFQTLLNRDLVKPSRRLFVIGGGNVGLIASYHALQAGIEVVGLVEAMPQVGGYKVHADKIKRLGVPIFLSHTVVKAEGDEEGVRKVVIAQVDKNFKPILGTEKEFEVDTILIAVGLSSVDELYKMALESGIDVYRTGDAREIAEASAAMFGGRIVGLEIAKSFGCEVEIPKEWFDKEEILKSKPGKIYGVFAPAKEEKVFPVINCIQEIPCNPCRDVCPKGCIQMEGDEILGVPKYVGGCIGCKKCVAICPGLAIVLVDYRKADEKEAFVTIPYELMPNGISKGTQVLAVDIEGNFVCDAKVVSVSSPSFADKTLLITLKVPRDKAVKVAGIKAPFLAKKQTPSVPASISQNDDVVVCSCMRVRKKEIVEKIREGVLDLNQLKAQLDVGLGACGGKTCEPLIKKIYREEGVDPNKVVGYTKRPPIMEVPLKTFAGMKEED